MWENLCVLCRSSISAAKVMNASHMILLSMLAISLESGCLDVTVCIVCTGCGAGPLLCSVVITALGQGLSSSCWVRLWGSGLIRLLPLSVCSVWRVGNEVMRFHVHNEPIRHPHRHLWFCPEATQDLVLFSIVFISDLVLAVLQSELVLGTGALGCRS